MVEPTDVAGVWDRLVSESQKRLASNKPNETPNRKLSLTLSPIRRHEPNVEREASRIPMEIRKVLRATASGLVRWPILLCGDPGTGKTSASLCLVDHAPGSEWWTWEGFWRFVGDVNMGRAMEERKPVAAAGYREVSKPIKWSHRGFWKWFRDLPLAVIDDVGLRSTANDTQYEALKMALDQRHGLPLLVTSNLDPAALGIVFDLRIMDRIGSGTVIKLEGKSMR